MFSHLRGHALAVMIVTALIAAGCAQEPTVPHADGSVVGARNSFDIFLGEELGLIDYAIRRVRNECLADAGYPQNLNDMEQGPTRAFPNLVVTERSFGPTSEDEARRVGFGRDSAAQPARIVSFDANYDINLERCERQAHTVLGPRSEEVIASYYELGNLLSSEFTRAMVDLIDRDLPGIAQELLVCLRSFGYEPLDRERFLNEPDPAEFGIAFGDLEADPSGASTWQPDRVEGTVQFGPPIPALRYIPTPEESELAVAWFQCRHETGLTETLISSLERAQAEIIMEYEEALTELNPQIQDLARKAAEALND